MVEVKTNQLMIIGSTSEVLSRENSWDFSIYDDDDCDWGNSDSNSDSNNDDYDYLSPRTRGL